MRTYVYDFIEGDRSRADLLGGKGANLAEMTRLGLPVPPGFTVTTDACRAYLATGTPPDGLYEEINAHLRQVEARLDRRLGDPDDPLLLAVRSGRRTGCRWRGWPPAGSPSRPAPTRPTPARRAAP